MHARQRSRKAILPFLASLHDAEPQTRTMGKARAAHEKALLDEKQWASSIDKLDLSAKVAIFE